MALIFIVGRRIKARTEDRTLAGAKSNKLETVMKLLQIAAHQVVCIIGRPYQLCRLARRPVTRDIEDGERRGRLQCFKVKAVGFEKAVNQLARELGFDLET